MAPEEIFRQNIYCTIATINKDGSPWSSPVFFAFDQAKNIYWWSPLKATHSQNIIRDERAFINIFNSQVPESKGKGLYIKARAKIVEDLRELEHAINVYNKRSKVFKLSIKNSSGEAPTRIFLAEPEMIWTNIDKKEKGYFLDSREQVS